jgi:hypothetical protein
MLVPEYVLRNGDVYKKLNASVSKNRVPNRVKSRLYSFGYCHLLVTDVSDPVGVSKIFVPYVDVFLASIACNNDQQQTLTSIIQRLPRALVPYYFLSSLSIQFAAELVALVKTHLSQSSP